MGILQDHQYASFNKRKENKNKNVKIWEKEETDEERLQAVFCPPLDSSLITAIWNDTYNYDASAEILSALAEEANQALDLQEKEEQKYVDESCSTSITTTTESEDENFTFLLNCFPSLSIDDLKNALQSQDHDVEKATDLLLNREFLNHDDDDNRTRSTKKKKKKKKIVISGQLPHAQTSNDAYEEMAKIPFNHWKQYDEVANMIGRYFPNLTKFIITTCVQRCRGNVIASVKAIMQKAPEEKPEHEFNWASMKDLIHVKRELEAIMVDRSKLDVHRVAVGTIILLQGQDKSVDQITQAAVEHFLTFDVSQMELEARLEKMASEADSMRVKAKQRGIPVIPEYLSIHNQKTYVEDNPDECRDIAMQLIMERNELYRKAAAAYRKARNKGPEGGVAFYYSDIAREIDSKAKDWNMRAARATVRQHRLRQNDDHLLDLHGLTIAEARVVLMEGVTQWWSRSQMQSARRLIQPLRIITGVGKHSEYGESKLLPMTMKFLRSEGYGSSSVVYNAVYKPKNTRVALKMIDFELFERNQIDEVRRETALMALCKHPNILKVYGSFMSGSKLYIATPYLSGGSCLDMMKSGFEDGFEEITIATILKQALEGIIYLHKNGHIHRDVKAGNLLMDNQGAVLLSDFGVSSSLTENSEIRKTFVGTPCWMAPEVMEQSGYNLKADIWSFGITAIELATGHAPFAKFPPMKVLMMTLNQSPPTLNRKQTKHKYSHTFKEMIDLCLQKDPTKRPTADKLVLHPFFKQAKKGDYLVKSVLARVPPLDQRTHKKVEFKQTHIESNTAHWNFDDDKHITFGGAVINNIEIGLPSPVPSEPETISPTRKSRFVIEDLSHESYHVPESPPHDWQIGIGLGISDPQPDNEVKKGRFSVNQLLKPEHLLLDASSEMPRVTSSENICKEGRKSRFEVQHLSQQESLQANPESLTKGNSKNRDRVTSNYSGKIGRFSIEKEEPVAHETSPDCRKKGRFELMGALPSETFGPHNHQPPTMSQNQVETLLRKIEAQKFILYNILHSMPSTDIQRLSSPIIEESYFQQKATKSSMYNDMTSAIDDLQKILISTHQEKYKLLKENEALKLEIEQLKSKSSSIVIEH
ncbi:hypothetical protein G6F61_005435 [Rhizopus arrhizus]|nr:hypothetical protein G6F61_005435 [Rhizopus arrhizus]